MKGWRLIHCGALCVKLCQLVVEVASSMLDGDTEHRTKMAVSDKGLCIWSQADN